MTGKQALKKSIYNTLQSLGIVPNLWSVGNAFKMLEYQQLLKSIRLQRHHIVLDFGCGKGTQTELLAKHCAKVVGIDLSQRMIDEGNVRLKRSAIRDRVELRCTTLETFPDESFDRVVSFSVLEHVSGLPNVLREMARVLRPGGELHMSVDALTSLKDSALVAKHKKDHLVVQYFTPATLQPTLEAAGLQVRRIFPIFTSADAQVAFKQRILEGGPRYSGKYLLYRKLRNSEASSAQNEGLMLIASAVRSKA